VIAGDVCIYWTSVQLHTIGERLLGRRGATREGKIVARAAPALGD